jgi:hypothetical protein
VRHVASEHRLEVPVRLPTTDATVVVDYGQRRVTVATRRHPFREALVFLHKMPGPHNASVRGNSNFVRAWARLADASAYGLLFLTLSGVYLWTALKAERTIGILLIVAGALSFFGLVYGLVG